MSYFSDIQDEADRKEFLKELGDKLAIINSAIDSLVDLADAGLGGPKTSDALVYLNEKRSSVEREYKERS